MVANFYFCINPSLHYTHEVPSYSIQFYRLTNSSVIPDEGPEVTRIPHLLRLRMRDPFTHLLDILLFTLILSELLTSVFSASQYS